MATLASKQLPSTTFLFAIVITFLFFHLTSAQPRTYIVHMDKSAMPRAFSSRQSWFKSTLSSISENSIPPISISSKLIHTYTNSIHGFSATLTVSELESLKNIPGFVHSTPDYPLNPHTTHTPEFLGLSSASGLWPASCFGEGVVIGVVDSGVWPESESFGDGGMTDAPANWKGKCESGQEFNSSLCNKKLIGARFYNAGIRANLPEINITMNSPRDDEGHGSHTASTAVGNFVKGASYLGYAAGTARGMAPRARLAIYKAIWGGSVYSSDALAAIDQAIEDGVDVLSLSLGFNLGKDKFFEDDAVALATFAAMEKGIFVAASAGNNGHLPGTINNGAPWLTTVGAGIVDRQFEGDLVLENGTKIAFGSLYAGNYSGLQVPLLLIDTCTDVERLRKIKNKIIVCRESENVSLEDQIEAVKCARSISGAVFITDYKLWGEFYHYTFAASFISVEDGEKVINYINKTKNPTGALEFRKTVLGTKPAPRVDEYSSRGPFVRSPSVLKPDVLAPGSSILAAWSPVSSVAKVQSQPLFSNFNIISGTSMAAPHVAGVGALIKAVHPDWSPAGIRSAIMTTANPLDNTRSPIKDAGNFDHEASPLDIGAGFIVPSKAVDPGLIYDATTEDYVKLLCALNYTAMQIQIITKSKHSCDEKSSDLNYPSFVAYFDDFEGSGSDEKVVREFTRTVTNVGKARSIYRANLTGMSGLKVDVEPKKLVFEKKFEKQSYKLTVEGPRYLEEEVAKGSLIWVEKSRKYVVRSPIVATNIDPMTT
ncbi:hypothetical protein TIFTF001_002724 [Ficus carica]|uniref:Subtilisin-like protease SBT1.9 n=1 Tax=Ficus carica TaxID=3494 RepID=A0AA87ZCT4_FICCA|nr:hypothetical protein TIFTF001_002724 [Ficus carica]